MSKRTTAATKKKKAKKKSKLSAKRTKGTPAPAARKPARAQSAKPTPAKEIEVHCEYTGLVPVRKLKGNPKNPNKHPTSQVIRLAGVIEAHGWRVPITVSRQSGFIVRGHCRWLAAKKLGVKSVPVDYQHYQSKATEMADLIADNRLAELASMDYGLLLENLQGIGDFAQAGYDAKELALLEIQVAQLKEKEGFRVGDGHLQPDEDASDFWLKKKDMAQFSHIKNVVLDFSGGRDSTLALAWICKHFSDRKIYPVFSDVGVEFPGMGAHIHKACEFFKVEAVIVKPELEWWSWLRKLGEWPSLLFRPCQDEFVHLPIERFTKKYCKPEETLLVDGYRAGQAVRGSKKNKTSAKGARLKNYTAYHPCFGLKDAAFNQLLYENVQPPLWEGYSKGFVRSACWCCPGQCGLQAFALERNYPGLSAEMIVWEKRIGPLRPLHTGRGDSHPTTWAALVEAGRKKFERAEKKKKE